MAGSRPPHTHSHKIRKQERFECRNRLAHPRNLASMPHFYILECIDRTMYVGSTIDLERRIEQHQRGEGSSYTRRRLPVRLIFSQEFERIEDAFALEKQVQGWSRAKRIALIEGRFDALPGLSRKRWRRGE
ncbi:GIY-YIG nuclease family protein [Agromyces sp. NPDC057865]|uniref:GIY-YIG nuclease family protein n=1 Tax=Agromyces sp. NPDC057865 TaxID=3346267 RepID=UPI00366D45BD